MKIITILTTALGSVLVLLVAVHIAQAACVMPISLPANDVSLDGFTFELASLPQSALEVDMNGIQRSMSDKLAWATHGTLVVVINATGSLDLIASWTQNSYRDTAEWVCRMELDPGTAMAVGDGAVHTVDPVTGTIVTTFIQECKMDLSSDCP